MGKSITTRRTNSLSLRLQGLPVAMLSRLIDCYRFAISPLLGHHCRFFPSCSCYARDALQVHGLKSGLWLAMRRVLRCHPWHEGGVDPVPAAQTGEQH